MKNVKNATLCMLHCLYKLYNKKLSRAARACILSSLLMYTAVQFSSCEKDYNYVNPATTTNQTQNPADTTGTSGNSVSFKASVIPIFDAKCNSCHSSTNPVLTAANAYQALTSVAGKYINTGNPSNSLLLTTFDSGGKMNPLGVTYTSEEKDKILKWIQQGAKNN